MVDGELIEARLWGLETLLLYVTTSPVSPPWLPWTWAEPWHSEQKLCSAAWKKPSLPSPPSLVPHLLLLLVLWLLAL